MLGHLLAFLVQDQVVDQDVLVRRLAHDEGGDGHQRVEPAACLVDALADEVSREQLIKVVFVFKWIVPLRIRHGAGVKPAVHDLGDTCHRAAALAAGEMDVIHVRTMELDVAGDVFLRAVRQFLTGADTLDIAALAAPDRDRGAPVTVSGDRPVLDVRDPVAKALFADEVRMPFDGVVVGNELILELGHLDVPTGLRIVDERCAAAPAVRIVMCDLLAGEQLVLRGQRLDDLDVKTVFHDEAAVPGCPDELALLVNRVDDRQAVLLAAVIVVFTECRSGMDDAGTIFHADVIHAGHVERFAVDLDVVHVLFVFHVLEVFALHLFDDLVLAFAEDLVSQRLCDVEVVAFLIAFGHLRLDIVEVGADGQRDVGCECPRRCGPCEEVLVVGALFLEFAGQRLDVDFFVALRDFVGSQARAAARAVRQDLVSFVDQTGLEELVDDPPDGLDVVVVECDVRIVHIDEEAHALGHVAPHSFIGEDGLLALLVERLDAVLFDVLLAAHAELLFDFDLDRQTVGVPAGLTVDLVALHGLVAADAVFQRTRDDVVDARFAVRCGRPFIEDEGRLAFSGCDALAEKILFLPLSDLFVLYLCDGQIR